eukprot:NODE_12270_length_210_cov_12.155280_g11529_i0.p1 GENE.NODE_12270_length_210_cov_12.155280_g11529_i0~~NODE_12270_length_210_cov_12.155280_g11529_i0.p1  ORF type:complete len:50 (-),score=3.14 NODE_12270_length_210_cov_12.155280_g11529_i0:40-189(-)
MLGTSWCWHNRSVGYSQLGGGALYTRSREGRQSGSIDNRRERVWGGGDI